MTTRVDDMITIVKSFINRRGTGWRMVMMVPDKLFWYVACCCVFGVHGCSMFVPRCLYMYICSMSSVIWGSNFHRFVFCVGMREILVVVARVFRIWLVHYSEAVILTASALLFLCSLCNHGNPFVFPNYNNFGFPMKPCVNRRRQCYNRWEIYQQWQLTYQQEPAYCQCNHWRGNHWPPRATWVPWWPKESWIDWGLPWLRAACSLGDPAMGTRWKYPRFDQQK